MRLGFFGNVPWKPDYGSDHAGALRGQVNGMILYHLFEGKMRFSELMRAIGCVTQRMSTKQLRELEANGLVNRIVYAEVPPRVESELTEDGESLTRIFHEVKTVWWD